MKIVLLQIAAAALLALSISSCGAKKADEKAAQACAVKEDSNAAFKDGEACKTCCEKAGASGHMWMLGDGCKCL